MRRWIPFLAGATIFMATQAAAQDDTVKHERKERRTTNASTDWRLYVSSGVSYSRRDDDNGPRTDYYRVPLVARLSRGPLRFSASVPYLVVKGAAAVFGDDDDDSGEIVDSDARETRSGFGDLSLTARYRLPKRALGGFDLDLMSRVKIPTASRQKRLGTGEVDYAVGAELSRDVGRFGPFVSAQYRVNGDPPDRDYHNTVATSVGSIMRLSRRTSVSLAHDYSQSRIRGRNGSHMLDGGLTTRLSRRMTLGGDAAIGLSKTAPNFRVGASLTMRAF